MNQASRQAQAVFDLAKRYQGVLERIRSAALRAGRDPASVHLVGACKAKPGALIADAVALGLEDLGENYLSDALDHQAAVHAKGSSPRWHFIGPIQSNKTRDIAERFDWVHSLDRDKIARRINDQRPDASAALNVLIQVNISEEASKSGLLPDDLLEFAHSLDQYPRLKLRGLMAIPAPDDDTAFRRIAELSKQLRQYLPAATVLSMGMSADLEQAILEGATMVRVGTELFGARE